MRVSGAAPDEPWAALGGSPSSATSPAGPCAGLSVEDGRSVPIDRWQARRLAKAEAHRLGFESGSSRRASRWLVATCWCIDGAVREGAAVRRRRGNGRHGPSASPFLNGGTAAVNGSFDNRTEPVARELGRAPGVVGKDRCSSEHRSRAPRSSLPIWPAVGSVGGQGGGEMTLWTAWSMCGRFSRGAPGPGPRRRGVATGCERSPARDRRRRDRRQRLPRHGVAQARPPGVRRHLRRGEEIAKQHGGFDKLRAQIFGPGSACSRAPGSSPGCSRSRCTCRRPWTCPSRRSRSSSTGRSGAGDRRGARRAVRRGEPDGLASRQLQMADAEFAESVTALRLLLATGTA